MGVGVCFGAMLMCSFGVAPSTLTVLPVSVPTTLIGNKPALNNSCTLMCSYAGVITISYPGQVQTMV